MLDIYCVYRLRQLEVLLGQTCTSVVYSVTKWNYIIIDVWTSCTCELYSSRGLSTWLSMVVPDTSKIAYFIHMCLVCWWKILAILCCALSRSTCSLEQEVVNKWIALVRDLHCKKWCVVLTQVRDYCGNYHEKTQEKTHVCHNSHALCVKTTHHFLQCSAKPRLRDYLVALL